MVWTYRVWTRVSVTSDARHVPLSLSPLLSVTSQTRPFLSFAQAARLALRSVTSQVVEISGKAVEESRDRQAAIRVRIRI